MGDSYDLAYKPISELPEDTSEPTSGDLITRYDNSAGMMKKVDASDLDAMLGVSATAVEINKNCDPGARRVTLSTSTTLTSSTHDSAQIVISDANGGTYTLPAAYAGARYRILIGATVTSGSITIVAPNAFTTLRGAAYGVDTDVTNGTGYYWATASDTDTITLNGTSTGGKIGDYIELDFMTSNTWSVRAFIQQSGGSEATPFSATVS